MNSANDFPIASEPDCYIGGKLIPADVMRLIRRAWMAGVVATVLKLLVAIAAVGGFFGSGFDAWLFADAGLAAALTYGIYRRSRLCAISMVLHIVAATLMSSGDGRPGGAAMVVPAIFLYFHVGGVVGTLRLHRILRGDARSNS